MTLENNRTPILYHSKLWASFQSHRWSQTWVTIRKHSIRVKIGNFLSRVTLKCDRWPWKTIGHLAYTPSSFVHNFIAIGEFKLELQSGNAQFGSKSTIFFNPCDLEIWRMTLQNNRAPLPYYIKLWASFQSHELIQSGVTVRKRSIRVKIGNFLSRATLTFNGWPRKTIGHISYAASSSVHHFMAIGEFKMELQSGNAQFGTKSTIFLAVWPWNLTDMWIQTGVMVRKRLSGVMTSMTLTFDLWTWWYDDRHMVKKMSQTDRRTGRQTDRQTDGRTEVFLELLGRS